MQTAKTKPGRGPRPKNHGLVDLGTIGTMRQGDGLNIDGLRHKSHGGNRPAGIVCRGRDLAHCFLQWLFFEVSANFGETVFIAQPRRESVDKSDSHSIGFRSPFVIAYD